MEDELEYNNPILIIYDPIMGAMYEPITFEKPNKEGDDTIIDDIEFDD